MSNWTNIYHCDLPPYFPPILEIPEAVNIIQACIALLSAVVSLPLNFYLFIIIVKFPVLHQRSLYLSLQIIVVEILYHSLIPATILISTIHGEWIFGRVACNIAGMIHDGFALFRFTMTLVFTIDRFISVYKPFFKYGGSIAWILSVIVWLITLIQVILPLSGILDCYTYFPSFKTCTAYPDCSDSCEISVGLNTGFAFLNGVILPLCLYVAIFFIIYKITRYHNMIKDSIKKGRKRDHKESKAICAYNNVQQNRKKFFTIFILLITIAGSFPALPLYIASSFYTEGNSVLIIMNILIGRTLYTLVPFFDSLAFTRHQDVKEVSSKIFQSLNLKFSPAARMQSSDQSHSHPSVTM